MLEFDDVVDILTACAAGDRRTVGEADVTIWLATLTRADVTSKADAIQAVVNHLAESDAYLMPIHVIRGVAAIRAERAKNMPSSDILMADADPNLLPSEYPAELRRRQKAWADAQAGAPLRAVEGGK